MLTPNTWKRFSFPEKPPKVLLQNRHAKSRGLSRSQSHRKTPRSKADMTMLCRSHSAGCKTPVPAAGDHCSGAHVRLSRVEGGCRALKFPTPKAIQSDLQQPTNSILPSTILILPPLIWASHPTEMAGPAGEIFISIQAGRRGWGLLHPRNQAKQGRTVGFAPHIQTPTPALHTPREPHPGLPLLSTHPSLSPPSPPPLRKGHPSLPGNRNKRSAAGTADRCVTAATTLSRCHAKASSYYNRSGRGCDRPQTQGCAPVGCAGFGTMQNTKWMHCPLFLLPDPQLTGL